MGLMFLFNVGLPCLINKLSFILNRMVKPSNRGSWLQNWSWSRIELSVGGLTFLKVNADVLSRLRIKDAALNSFRFYNANAPQNLSDEELKALDRFSENKTLVVQKTDNGNSVVLVDRDVFVKHRENIVRDNTKFEKVDIKTRTLNFQVNPEKVLMKF